jgi:trimeric autotransporter adhesin
MNPRRYLLPALLLLGTATTTLAQSIGDDNWDTRFGAGPRTSATIQSMIHNGDELIVAGSISMIDDVPVSHLARWRFDAHRWEAFSNDTLDGVVTVMDQAPDRSRLFIAGTFRHIGSSAIARIAMWNRATETWSALDGVDSIDLDNGGVYALHADATNLYVAGVFRFRSGEPSWNIARWNYADRTWHRLGRGLGPQSLPLDLATIGDELFVAGQIDSAGGLGARSIARWDKSAERWDTLGSGLLGIAGALAPIGDDLYVGGNFSRAGSVAARNLARWNTASRSWHPVDTGIGSAMTQIEDLAVVGDRLAIGLSGVLSDLAVLPGVMMLDPATGTLSIPAGSTNGMTITLASSGDEVVVAGTFSRAGDARVPGLALYDRGSDEWSALTSREYHGLSAVVRAIAPSNDGFFVGGAFRDAGFTRVNGVALWSGERWHALGDGVDGTVHALLASNDTLYVGGLFSSADSQSVNNVARWDTTERRWSPMGAGFNSAVRALARDASGRIYAGGEFTQSGGVELGGVARWDGSAWRPLGSASAAGVEGIVIALAVVGDDLYVGGNFTSAGGNDEIIHIARYDLTSETWSPVGDGVDRIILALLADGTDLYAAGPITRAGAARVDGVARWDGSAWSAVGSGITEDGAVYALAKHRGDIVAAGTFVTTDAPSTRFLAVLDGSRWMPLGSGIDSTAFALSSVGDDLVVGGLFLNAGGSSSLRVAVWHGVASGAPDERPPGTSLRIAPMPIGEDAVLDLELISRDRVAIDAIDALGRVVAVIEGSEMAAGRHRLSLDCSGLHAGAWFMRIRVGNRIHVVPTTVR